MLHDRHLDIFLAYLSGFKAGFMVFQAHLELLYSRKHISKLKITKTKRSDKTLKEILYSKKLFWIT